MCVLRGTNLTAKPQHAKERNSRGAPTRRTGIPGDDRTDARAAHRHVIDSFIGGRWSARSEDGVGTDVLLVGGWGADEIRPLRLSRQPFRDIWKSVASGDTVPVTHSTTGVGPVVRIFFPSPTVCPVQRSQQPRKNRARQASKRPRDEPENGISAAAGRQGSNATPPSSARTGHARSHAPATLSARLGRRAAPVHVRGPAPAAQRTPRLASETKPLLPTPPQSSPSSAPPPSQLLCSFPSIKLRQFGSGGRSPRSFAPPLRPFSLHSPLYDCPHSGDPPAVGLA
jgi:hypothetical protein